VTEQTPAELQLPESLDTVIVAGMFNLGIALAKVAGGVLAGSTAMLSEAAHSFAYTLTEILLYIALPLGRGLRTSCISKVQLRLGHAGRVRHAVPRRWIRDHTRCARDRRPYPNRRLPRA
jgi:hypothetical protein